jgi:FAD synthetase
MRVLVFGTFDHLHPGHRFLLDAAGERGELFVVVACDEVVQHIKGFLPTQNQEERMKAIEEVYPTATVLCGDAQDYLVPVREAKPDLVLLGYDQQFPPGITEADLPCPIERTEPHKPDLYKSSILRKEG